MHVMYNLCSVWYKRDAHLCFDNHRKTQWLLEFVVRSLKKNSFVQRRCRDIWLIDIQRNQMRINMCMSILIAELMIIRHWRTLMIYCMKQWIYDDVGMILLLIYSRTELWFCACKLLMFVYSLLSVVWLYCVPSLGDG